MAGAKGLREVTLNASVAEKNGMEEEREIEKTPIMDPALHNRQHLENHMWLGTTHCTKTMPSCFQRG
jgi:hypothetical protein